MAEVVREATAAYVSGEGRTLRLPAEVAAGLETAAAARGASAEALAVELLRDALADHVPRPTLPLTTDGWGVGDEAERVDELLGRGFGETG